MLRRYQRTNLNPNPNPNPNLNPNLNQNPNLNPNLNLTLWVREGDDQLNPLTRQTIPRIASFRFTVFGFRLGLGAGTDIKLWTACDGKCVGSADTSQLKNTMAALSPDGRFLAAAAFTADVKVRYGTIRGGRAKGGGSFMQCLIHGWWGGWGPGMGWGWVQIWELVYGKDSSLHTVTKVMQLKGHQVGPTPPQALGVG